LDRPKLPGQKEGRQMEVFDQERTGAGKRLSKRSVGRRPLQLPAAGFLALLMGSWLTTGAGAAVPETLQYQGKLHVQGRPFSGNAAMKFALIDAAGQSLWSNDGSSVGGSEPASSVEIEVEGGVFSVALGSAAMDPIPAAAFAAGAVSLRVWIRPDGGAFEQLSPDRELSSVGFSFRAAEAEDSGKLGGASAAFYRNASNLNQGTIPDARLSSSVTLQGNSFNAPGGLVKLDGSGLLPALNGSQLTGVTVQVHNITAAVPAAPFNLHLRPGPDGPSSPLLSWSMGSLAGVASFVAYQSGAPITESNKALATPRVSGELQVPVSLFPGSGVQRFRVEARNVLGQAGPLSVELAVDTAFRLAYRADQDIDNAIELYVVAGTGGGTTKVNHPPLASGRTVKEFAWSPDGSRLAYRANQDAFERTDLHVAAASGGAAIKVSELPLENLREVLQFAWSPDGSRLAYTANQEAVNRIDLYVVAATGGATTKLSVLPTAGQKVGVFAWSPDGSRLAYVADQTTPGTAELYVVAATGGAATKLSALPGNDRDVVDLAWSPDGSRLAYRANQDAINLTDLYVVAAPGGAVTKVSALVASTNSKSVVGFAWSPDGSRLAYFGDQVTVNVRELYVVAATGGTATKVSTFPENNRNVRAFAWSPDGSRLAYIADQTTPGAGDLYVVAATGGAATKLSVLQDDSRDVVRFAWSPDGSRLAYGADQDKPDAIELYVAPATGGGATKVSGPLAAVAGTGITNPIAFAFAWSPDGSRLAYINDQDTDERVELYVVAARGGGLIKVSALPLPVDASRDVLSLAWSLPGGR
jgi:Tol biopolymer transport system component